uniref:B30.2/SPRY domain-containing protein n=2 Tax=Sphaeramia orbicularis TaxID=375764 RepID=A0A673A621_9TELE
MDQSDDREEGALPWKTTHRPPTGPGPGSRPGPRPSCVSLKSDDSMDRWIDFKTGRVSQTHVHSPGPGSRTGSGSGSGTGPGPSCVSIKSDDSMDRWIDFKAGRVSETHVHSPGPGSRTGSGSGSGTGPGPSCVSIKSDDSMDRWIDFKAGRVSETQVEQQSSEVPTGLQDQTQLDSIFKLLEENICTFVKNELKKFHQVLSTNYPECLESLSDEDEEQRRSSEAFLKITLNFLRRLKQEELAERLHRRSQSGVQQKLKRNLQQKFECVFEGIAKAGNPKTLLNQIYTELYITEGGATEVNQEHEVRQIETASRNPHRPPTTITCEDIFKTPPDRDQPIRTVLTKGVAGIGKTVSTQKFSLDWAEDKANQDIHFIFPFTFRELNVLKQKKFSLVELVHHFFTETKEAGIWIFEDLQVVFILDGLDECRPPLDFNNTQILTDVTESTSVDVLLMNLIRGNLLPSARLWITTRPAAANQIPAQCVDMVTEVRGFTDPQKEEYFRKRFTDEEQTNTIISHIKMSRSVHIMCHVPVFCWITATVLEDVLKTTDRRQLPKTLTEMYIHFLVVQVKVKNVKYDGRSETDPHWSPETRKMIESLGKLAFEQLKKGNLIFYESDLTECGIDISSASVYSGVFTEVFKEERGLYQDKRFCFIHLSVQEFLAALHVHQTFINTGVNLLSEEQTSVWSQLLWDTSVQLYQTAVDQALQSPNGHLDLFLRFLLGLSLQTNQSLLQSLVKPTGSSSKINQKTIKYIKEKIVENVSAERSINLFHCLNELEDGSLVDQIQQYLRSGRLSTEQLSPAQWSALAFILLSSEEDLDVFDLKEYSGSEEVLLRLLPVVKASNKALLSGCNLSERSCEALSSILGSQSCSLTHLDLSKNDLKDSGVKILSDGLKSPGCRLDTLRLSGCLITEEGCSSLVSALKSNPSHLRQLDLSYNHPGASGQELSALVEDPHWRLDTVRLEPAGVQMLTPGPWRHFCELTLDPNTANEYFELSENNKKVERVEKDQSYPDHQDRFEFHPQLMCSTGLTGRCYWEVQWSGNVYISVTYRGIMRKGGSEDCWFGGNDQSWSLECYEGGYTVWHKNKRRDLPQSSSSSSSGTVSVYVDCPAGCVSFYRVSSDKLIHIYTFKTTFTEPLFGGFGLYDSGSSVCLCGV